MKTRFTKSLVLLLAAIMAAVALPIYAGAESIGFEEAKASKIFSECDAKGHCWSPSYPEPTPGTVLSTGSSGNYVRWLQECLNMFGYNCGTIDGYYGNSTKNAVTAFQRKYSLGADGIFGRKTHTMIRLILCQPGPIEYYYYFKVTATSGLNVRSSTTTSASIIGALNYGATVRITDFSQKSDGNIWGRISYNGRVGYICMYLKSASAWYITAV